MDFIFGIDEAGRGPLAGPVAVGIFAIKKGHKIKYFPKGRDSKKMTEKERKYWFDIFKKEKEKGNVNFKVCFSSAKSIDRKGITTCVKKTIEKAIKELSKEVKIKAHSKILLDGLLCAPAGFLNQKTIIKGDEKKQVIACASIVAKVSRDRVMKKLSKKYPAYGFEKHKGYGTLFHRKSISKHGITVIHRKTFLKKNKVLH